MGSLRNGDEQNNSSSPPTPCPSVASLLGSSTVHSHGGYSLSSSAIGSCFVFMKFNPLSTVPASTLEAGNLAACFDGFGVGDALGG